MSETMIKPPAALVLAIGPDANEVTVQAQTIFLRSDPWRSSQSRFLTLFPTQDGGVEWQQTRPAKKVRASKKTRSQVYSSMLQSASAWLGQLDDALHALRIHVPGTTDKMTTPLNVILLANLTDSSSAAMYPVFVALHDLLSREPYSRVSLLLNVADFSSVKKRQETLACLAASLDDLCALFEGESSFATEICHSLNIPAPGLAASQIYLFDRYKEGVWEAASQAELNLLTGNFLLALLISEPGTFPAADLHFAGLPVLSVGATLLEYDPSALQEACAARLAIQVLEKEFGAATQPDLREVHTVTEKSAAVYADMSDWQTLLVEGTPFRVKPGRQMAFDLHFSDLSFENLPPEEWSLAISGHEGYFVESVLPAAKDRLMANSKDLASGVLMKQQEMLEGLPLLQSLYPGGMQACLKVIELLGERLEKRIHSLPEAVDAQRLQNALDDLLSQLDDAVQSLPTPPGWFRVIPSPLRSLARFLFALLYQREELARLANLRQQAVRATEEKYIGLAQDEARIQIASLCRKLTDSLDQAARDIDALQSVFSQAQTRLAKRKTLAIESDSAFCQSALDETVFEWAFERGRKTAEEMRLTVLEQDGFLDEWKSLDAKKVESILIAFGRSQYEFVWDVTLEETLANRAEMDLQPLWESLSQGAIPLLRPDFDLAGSSGQVFQSQFFLCQSARSTSFAPFLRIPLAEWQTCSTGDPYLVSCVRLRQGLTLGSLGGMPAQARQFFGKLAEAERAQFHLVPAQEGSGS